MKIPYFAIGVTLTCGVPLIMLVIDSIQRGYFPFVVGGIFGTLVCVATRIEEAREMQMTPAQRRAIREYYRSMGM